MNAMVRLSTFAQLEMEDKGFVAKTVEKICRSRVCLSMLIVPTFLVLVILLSSKIERESLEKLNFTHHVDILDEKESNNVALLRTSIFNV